jgi:hypothetical protein
MKELKILPGNTQRGLQMDLFIKGSCYELKSTKKKLRMETISKPKKIKTDMLTPKGSWRQAHQPKNHHVRRCLETTKKSMSTTNGQLMKPNGSYKDEKKQVI